MRFPSDDELHAGILSKNAYAISPQSRLEDILWELEQASRSNLSEKHEKPDELWVEHVLPRTWTEDWPFADTDYAAPNSDLPQTTSRRSSIDTLGNLTLVTNSLNISVGNKSFLEKKRKFSDHTGLFLNKWFHNQEKWAEKEIAHRGEHLALLAKAIWPYIGSLQINQNK